MGIHTDLMSTRQHSEVVIMEVWCYLCTAQLALPVSFCFCNILGCAGPVLGWAQGMPCSWVSNRSACRPACFFLLMSYKSYAASKDMSRPILGPKEAPFGGQHQDIRDISHFAFWNFMAKNFCHRRELDVRPRDPLTLNKMHQMHRHQ